MQEIDATLQALAHRAIQAPPDVRACVAAALRRALGIVEGNDTRILRALDAAARQCAAAVAAIERAERAVEERRPFIVPARQ